MAFLITRLIPTETPLAGIGPLSAPLHAFAEFFAVDSSLLEVAASEGKAEEEFGAARHAYRHDSEGPDDMPAHIKGALTSTQHSVPITDHHMTLGTWQGIFLFEHRRVPRDREIVLQLIGE